MSEAIRYAENIKELMAYHLGKQILVEEIQLANIQYYEGGELEEPKSEELAA
jgi:hypothetical protein